MVRGRKPKPSAVHEANGSYLKNPQRKNTREPKVVSGMPDIPDWIIDNPLAMKCWESTCERLSDMGLLKVTDGMPIAAYCSDYAQWLILRAACANGQVSESTQTGKTTKVEAREVHKYQERMMKFWNEYGFTPSGRARLVVEQEEQDNTISELVSYMAG